MTKKEAKVLIKEELKISHKLAIARKQKDGESIEIYETLLHQKIYDEAHRILARAL